MYGSNNMHGERIKIRSHISEGADFNTAGKRRILEDILQAILKKQSVSLGKGLKWIKLEKNCEVP